MALYNELIMINKKALLVSIMCVCNLMASDDGIVLGEIQERNIVTLTQDGDNDVAKKNIANAKSVSSKPDSENVLQNDVDEINQFEAYIQAILRNKNQEFDIQKLIDNKNKYDADEYAKCMICVGNCMLKTKRKEIINGVIAAGNKIVKRYFQKCNEKFVNFVCNVLMIDHTEDRDVLLGCIYAELLRAVNSYINITKRDIVEDPTMNRYLLPVWISDASLHGNKTRLRSVNDVLEACVAEEMYTDCMFLHGVLLMLCDFAEELSDKVRKSFSKIEDAIKIDDYTSNNNLDEYEMKDIIFHYLKQNYDSSLGEMVI